MPTRSPPSFGLFFLFLARRGKARPDRPARGRTASRFDLHFFRRCTPAHTHTLTFLNNHYNTQTKEKEKKKTEKREKETLPATGSLAADNREPGVARLRRTCRTCASRRRSWCVHTVSRARYRRRAPGWGATAQEGGVERGVGRGVERGVGRGDEGEAARPPAAPAPFG